MHKKIHQQVVKNKKAITLFSGLLLIPLVLSAIFFITRGTDPHISELAFTEHSVLGKNAGSVIPASCESGVVHPYIDINRATGEEFLNYNGCLNAVTGPPTDFQMQRVPDGAQAPAPTVTASVSPTSVSYGGYSDYLGYYSEGASYCNYGRTSDAWFGQGPFYSNQTWDFICYNALGLSGQRSVTLTVCPASAPTWNGSACVSPAPPTVSVSVNPSTIGYGQTFDISYSSTNATYCTMYASTGWTERRSESFFIWYSWGGPQYASKYFQVECVNSTSNTSVLSPITYVTVSPLPTVTASVSPTNISYGGNTDSISYSSTNASYCNYGPTSYTWGPNGPFYSDQTWTFICYNSAGQSAQQSVTLTVCQPPNTTWNGSACVSPITATLSPFSPSTIDAGNSSTFSYSSTNATACSGSGIVSGDLGGTSNTSVSTGFIDTPGTYTQSVTCTGPRGSGTSGTRSLTVNSWPPASNAASDASGITFSTTPQSLSQPGNISLFFVIGTPTTQCKITATPYVTNDTPAKQAARNADAAALTASFTSSNTRTDVNDPYNGAYLSGRPILRALTRPDTVTNDGKARGKKTVMLNYSTILQMSCDGGVTKKSQVIRLTKEKEI